MLSVFRPDVCTSQIKVDYSGAAWRLKGFCLGVMRAAEGNGVNLKADVLYLGAT